MQAETHSKEREKAFHELIARNKDFIYNVCKSYRFSASWEIEDAYQEVLCTLWRDMDKFERRSSERTWIFRVAKTTLLQLKRKESNLPQPEVGTPAPFYEEKTPDMENYDFLMQLVDNLAKLDSQIVHAYIEGFSYKEIAQMTHLTVPAVAMRLVRAKEQLRSAYNKAK